MIRRPPRSTQGVSSAASDVYKRQVSTQSTWGKQQMKRQELELYLKKPKKKHEESKTSSSGLFRMINKMLHTEKSVFSRNFFLTHPKHFQQYHEQYNLMLAKWSKKSHGFHYCRTTASQVFCKFCGRLWLR
eukprot:TRINITY_DN1597_c0_g2_i1.p3 TRINITY_DN1597_c0_g2~~TRINITY_DN1597_c0_g2_i1.p3  ORF type:complete len:131 (-),score=28.99 TRINITY_DN1597_c0_g2_i1:504-896(-)